MFRIIKKLLKQIGVFFSLIIYVAQINESIDTELISRLEILEIKLSVLKKTT